MLKASAPVAILLAAFAFRTKQFSWKLLGIVALISLGVGVASYGEANLNYIGFTIQVRYPVGSADVGGRVAMLTDGLVGLSRSWLRSRLRRLG